VATRERTVAESLLVGINHVVLARNLEFTDPDGCNVDVTAFV
jgi:hypothetical protein